MPFVCECVFTVSEATKLKKPLVRLFYPARRLAFSAGIRGRSEKRESLYAFVQRTFIVASRLGWESKRRIRDTGPDIRHKSERLLKTSFDKRDARLRGRAGVQGRVELQPEARRDKQNQVVSATDRGNEPPLAD